MNALWSAPTAEQWIRSRPDCVGAGIFARQLALASGWSAREAEEFCLVVIELSSNAVRHAGGGRCTLDVSDAHLTAVFLDGGPGFPPAVLSDAGRSDRLGRAGVLPPGERQGHGLGSGLACARRFTTELRLENPPHGGARVTATKIRTAERTPWRRTV